MIKALADVIEKVRLLPPEQQAYAAGRLEDIVDGTEPGVVLSDEEKSLIEEGLRDIDAGRIVPDDEMAAFWKRLTQ